MMLMHDNLWFAAINILMVIKLVKLEITCSRGSVTFIRTPNVRPADNVLKELKKSSDEKILNLTDEECYHQCHNHDTCLGYFLKYASATECHLITAQYDGVVRHNLQEASDWSYHRKLCLSSDFVCRRHWAFDRLTSYTLLSLYDKTLHEIFSEEQCIEGCAGERSFVCRSARYDFHGRTCALSRHDRRTAPEMFRKITEQNIHYLENQCVSGPSKCMFHPSKGFTLVTSHVHIDGSAKTRDDCERSCLTHQNFTCRSYQFNSGRLTCLLSPEDSYSLGDSAIKSRKIDTASSGNTHQRHEYYERGSCIDVVMRCESTSMTAVVRVSAPFRGRVFAMSQPQQCFTTANRDNNEVILTMPLHGRHCGTRNLGNGTFTNSLVVQHHPYVLKNSDRRIDVACDYEEVHRKLRGGKQVMEGDMLTMTQVITGLAPTPPIKLKVVNSTGEEVRGVELGDSLYLKVDMIDESVFGIFGSELVARSGDGSESVLLIDDQGCPVEPAVFPALERTPKESKSLVAPFQAFRFASDAAVKFQMTVSFCLDTCQPVSCDVNSSSHVNEMKSSFGRRRRKRETITSSASGAAMLEELQSGDFVTDVTMETSVFVVSNLKELDNKKPLNRNESQYNSLNSHRHSTGPYGSSSDIDPGHSGICFSPLIFYSAAIVGCISQFSIFGLCFWVLMHGHHLRSSSSSYRDSSRASISSKTGLYEN